MWREQGLPESDLQPEQSGVAGKVPSRITRRPVTTVNCGTVSRLCQAWLRVRTLRKGTWVRNRSPQRNQC